MRACIGRERAGLRMPDGARRSEPLFKRKVVIGVAIRESGCWPHISDMAAYTVLPRVRQQGFKVEVVGDDGARQTMLGFDREEDAVAWVQVDRRRGFRAERLSGED